MRITPLDIADAAILDTDRRGDERGSFARWFCMDELAQLMGGSQICQVNHSFTQQTGSIRGLHFQYPPAAEKKVIRCLAGAVFDVVVDLRRDSSTFLQWRAVELSPRNDRALLLPEGCAHGFQTLADDTQLLYLHTAFYTPTLEGGLRYDDPRLNIAWPLPPAQISARDQQHPLLTDDFRGIAP